MKIHKIIKILIIICLESFALNSFAGFGESCSSLPTTSDGYLERRTAYGCVIGSIDMKAPGGNCNSAVAGITFCFKNIEGSSSPCTMYTLNEGDSKKISDLSADNNPDLGANPMLQNIVLTVKKWDNDLCLVMPTSRGPMPVACKSLSATPPPTPPGDENCNIGKSCYTGANYSQSLINFSGLAVQCLKETLNKIFFVGNNCSSQDQNSRITNLAAFSTFQGYLKRTIGAALILYTMFFAFNMVLNKEYASTEKIALFIIKFLFVAYFSIGLGPLDFSSGQPTKENGMLTYGLPLLTGAAPSFAQMVFNAAGSRGLCQFDNSKYKEGYKFYGLWDAIDCRIGYYLGLDLLYNIDVNGVLSSFSSGTGGPPGNNTPIPNFDPDGKNDRPEDLSKAGSLRFFAVMFGFFMSGNVIILAAGLVFSVIFLSILLYFITHYLVCMITIYVMTYVSPIFIPMALFNRTKAYFDGWLKVCISCALQPAVIAGFIALLITMYDSAIFKNCEFLRHDYEKGDIKFSTFELRLPSGGQDKCQESFGYKMLQYYAGEGWEEHLVILFPIKSIVRDVVSILAELLCVLVFSIIFYYFSKSIGRFAADLTNGPNMDAVTASPTKIVNLVKQGAAFLKDAAMATQGKPPVGDKPGESGRKGGEQGDDSSTSGGGSSDIGKDALSSGGGK